MRRLDIRPRPHLLAVAAGLLAVAYAGSRGAEAASTASRPTITYSTYLGGSGNPGSPDKDTGNGIAVDAAGNLYVTGATNSLGRWDADVIVRKLDPSGRQLLYETTFGSSDSDDAGYGIAVDGAGNAYVTGRWGDSMLGRGLGAFVAKLGPAGVPIYQVAFGADGDIGLSGDYGTRIAVDGSGNAYVAGTTFEPLGQPFPTTPGALQRKHGGGLTDAFVVKIGPSGSVLYSTLLGGGTFDRGWGIAVDASGRACVVGDSGGDFPTTAGSFQPAFSGESDVFVSKLDTSGSRLVYSTYLGGNGAEAGLAIAVDGTGHTYVTGRSETFPDWISGYAFPIVDAFQPAHAGGIADVFVTKLTPAGQIVYSSYLGGGQFESANDIAVSSAGRVYLTGRTESQDFPVEDAYQPNPGGGGGCDLGLCPDGFVTRIASGPPGEAALALDAARIRLRSGRPDVFALRGSLDLDPSLDPSSASVGVEIASPSGVLASFSLPAGALVKRASGAYVARDRAAATSGGVALAKLAVEPNRKAGVKLRAFGNAAATAAADMTITLTIGSRAYTARGTWQPVVGGWRLVTP